jgi:hypothetical protein
MNFYKIRHKPTGLYYAKNRSGKFLEDHWCYIDSLGRTFHSLSAAVKSLPCKSVAIKPQKPDTDFEIVEFKTIEV